MMTKEAVATPAGRPTGAWMRLAFVLVVAATVLVPSAEPAGATNPQIAVVAVGGRNDGTPACDTGRTVSSPDTAVSWPTSATAFTPSGAPCAGGGELYDVASRGSVMLAVGTRQLGTGTQGVAFRSVDGGATWTPVGSIPPTPPGVHALEAVASDGAGRWVAGGASNGSASPFGLYYSDDDGVTWTAGVTGQPPAHPQQIHDIAQRPGPGTGWVAVGSANSVALTAAVIMESNNGSTWSQPATWGANRDLALNGVAIDATGRVVAVGTSHAASANPGVNAPFILVKPASASAYAVWQAQYVTNTSMGGLNAVAMDAQGTAIMVGNKAVGNWTDAVAYRLPGSPLAALPSLSTVLPPTIESLEDVAFDPTGTWVVVGGDQGAVSRSTTSGVSWSPAIETMAGLKGRGLLRGVAFRA